jgi:hypothetical protein
MVEIVTIKPRDGPPRLLPASRLDLDELEKVRPGKPLRTVVTFPRSLPHLRWYRSLIGVVADGLGIHADTLHAQLKWEAGFVRRILTSEQFGVAVELESVAFKTMDEAKFTEFRELAVAILFKRYLPGVRRRDVYARVSDLLGEPCPW